MFQADGNFDTLKQIVARLRAPDGCPWDRKQTHESLKPACIEEAAEVICGINILEKTGSPENLKEELGDLLLQVIFHAQIAEEEGLFSIEDVIEGIGRKMVRRHPHVFGEEAARAAMALLIENSGKADGDGITPDVGPAGGAADSLLTDAAGAKKAGEVVLNWEEIKKLEKSGREWEKAFLPEALSEAGALLERARRRKFPEGEPPAGGES